MQYFTFRSHDSEPFEWFLKYRLEIIRVNERVVDTFVGGDESGITH